MMMIPRVSGPGTRELLRARGLRLPIDQANWPAFGGKEADGRKLPRAKAHIAHDGNGLHVLFEVEDLDVRARFTKDQDPVWRESCVELFLVLPGEPEGYYNFEFNAIGTLLSWFGPGRDDRTPQPQSALAAVQRDPSLGRYPLEMAGGPHSWDLLAYVPCTAFAQHRLESLEGLSIRANLYKCGDDLPVKHYFSWQKIDTPGPDFHRPEFFGLLQCE